MSMSLRFQSLIWIFGKLMEFPCADASMPFIQQQPVCENHCVGILSHSPLGLSKDLSFLYLPYHPFYSCMYRLRSFYKHSTSVFFFQMPRSKNKNLIRNLPEVSATTWDHLFGHSHAIPMPFPCHFHRAAV